MEFDASYVQSMCVILGNFQQRAPSNRRNVLIKKEKATNPREIERNIQQQQQSDSIEFI